MAGHSKWANIKHRKARADSYKGKLFTKLAKEIMVAAKEGGSDIEKNFRLRLAVDKAKQNNLPNENINRAIQKGAGEIGAESYQEATYEGYGPGKVAVLLEALTDNRNRTTAEIRNIFSKHGGNMGEAGCVSWMFERKGYLVIEKSDQLPSEDELLLIAMEAGAQDLKDEGGSYVVLTDPEDFVEVKQKLQQEGIQLSSAEVTMLPDINVHLEDKEEVEKLFKLMEALEEHDDVQNLYSNFEISEEMMDIFQT